MNQPDSALNDSRILAHLVIDRMCMRNPSLEHYDRMEMVDLASQAMEVLEQVVEMKSADFVESLITSFSTRFTKESLMPVFMVQSSLDNYIANIDKRTIIITLDSHTFSHHYKKIKEALEDRWEPNFCDQFNMCVMVMPKKGGRDCIKMYKPKHKDYSCIKMLYFDSLNNFVHSIWDSIAEFVSSQ